MPLEDDLLEQRMKRVGEIEALGFPAYGQRFDFTHTIAQLLAADGAKTAEELDAAKPRVRVAGRIETMRGKGKAGFFHLTQWGERLQVYVRKDAVSERDFKLFSCSISATSWASKATFSARAPASSACTRRNWSFYRRLCSPCRKSGTAWRMWKSATASATWI